MRDDVIPERCEDCGRQNVYRAYPWQMKVCEECQEEPAPLYQCNRCRALASALMVRHGFRGGPCECGGDVRQVLEWSGR